MAFRFPGRWPERDPGLNPLSEALEERRALGLPLFDLTVSNPTQCGLKFPEDWQELLGARAVRNYEPNPRGHAEARNAIAAYYNERDNQRDRVEAVNTEPVRPDDFFLTAGTSEGYSHLFKLLCEPGDRALIPRPSYPLLETLADLEGIALDTYSLNYSEGQEPDWNLDRTGLENALTPRTRIVFVVQPNNPTGSLLNASDTQWLLDLAQRRGLAVVVDEVFADYTQGVESHRFGSGSDSSGPLVFTLNGLSKLLGLPQLKLAWIHIAGNAADKDRAAGIMEWICDTYLSVGSAPQSACAELLRRRAEFQDPIRERIAQNLTALREFAEKHAGMKPLWPQGGWCVPVRCPGLVEAGLDDESFAIKLLKKEGVQVHPGYFFDFDSEDVIVLSLLPPPEIFREGLARLARLLSSFD
jgi:alanine-synthesizing transaminase